MYYSALIAIMLPCTHMVIVSAESLFAAISVDKTRASVFRLIFVILSSSARRYCTFKVELFAESHSEIAMLYCICFLNSVILVFAMQYRSFQFVMTQHL
jgi:hypothetical protein